MLNVNSIVVGGRLGNNPEAYDGGTFVTSSFSVAVNRSWKDKAGQKQEEVEWFNVKCFGAAAKFMNGSARKGDLVLVEGRIKTDVYTDKNNVQRRSVNVMADRVNLVASLSSSANVPSNDNQDIPL